MGMPHGDMCGVPRNLTLAATPTQTPLLTPAPPIIQAPIAGLQDTTAFLAQVIMAFQVSQKKMFSILKENTGAINQALATTSNLLPSSSGMNTRGNPIPRKDESAGNVCNVEVIIATSVTPTPVTVTPSSDQISSLQVSTSS